MCIHTVAYVYILYAFPSAPLLVLWPGEVEGTSLAMAQGKASPVGVLHESLGHSRYKKLKSNRGLRASHSRRCLDVAPATMASPTKDKEACRGTVGEG